MLLRRGHVDPVVAVSTPRGRVVAGDSQARWEIGSVTKVFTGLLLAVLAGDGTVHLDDAVTRHLPPRTPLAPGMEQITLEQLASHTAGLPRLPPGLARRPFSPAARADPYAEVDADWLLASLERTKVRRTPGTGDPRYSTFGTGLLGFALGRATGLGYERSLLESVVQPLGLAATSFADHPLHQGRHRGRPVGPWHLGALSGAGGLRSCADDVLVLLETVRDPSGPLAPAIVETCRPRASAGRLQVGLGWFMLADGDLLMHDGGTLGACSEVRVERHSGSCVVVLGDGRAGTARAATSLLKPR